MKRFIAFLLGGLCAAIILFIWYADTILPPFLREIEFQTIDYRMKHSRQPAVSDAIKIVLVNDVTNLSDQLTTFLKVVSTIEDGRYKPRVIGFNYLFDAPTANEELVAAVTAFGNVYYGYNFLFDPRKQDNQTINQEILPFRKEITDIGEEFSRVLEAQDVQLPAHKYLVTAGGLGFVNVSLDRDLVCRRSPIFLKYQGNWYGSLALLIAMEYLDIASVDITFYPGEHFEIIQDDGGGIKVIKIPVNRYGEMLIDFVYDPAVGGVAPFETLAMEDILTLAEQPDQPAHLGPLAKLQDAIVLVGSGSDLAPALQGIPLTKSYPLLGIQANVINNLLNNNFVRELGMSMTIGFLLVLNMLSGMLIAHRRFLVKLFLMLLVSGIYLLLAYGVFFQFRVLLPILPTLLAFALTLCSVGLLVRYTPRPVTGVHVHQEIVQEKKRKPKDASDTLSALEDELLEIREELDRKSFRLRSKIEELRMIQEKAESGQRDFSAYSGQIASLQKEIRAREIEIKSLAKKEEEIRRQVENLPFTDVTAAQTGHNLERTRRVFAKQGFITTNARLLTTLHRAEKLGKSSVTLLIQGESGTGKNLLANIIKQLSTRHNRPNLDVICGGDMDLLEDDLFGHRRGAFPGATEQRNGYLKEVDGGTLVLENIEMLSLEIQTRLIQALRGKAVRPIGDDHGYPIDVRVLATTDQDLKALVSAGRFREDLYHYFSVFPLYIPPLRDRKEDIPPLVMYFIQKYNRAYSKIVEIVSEEAINLLFSYQWPANVTELEKVIERAIAEINPGVKELSAQDITFEEVELTGGIKDHGMLNYLISLMDSNRELPDYQQLREKVLVEIQRLYCARLLRAHNGNVKSATVEAGLKEDTFKKMLSELMIDPDHYRM